MVKNEEGGTGEVTSFGALCTALSATIGTGNIVGVATAVGAGGPGALFWMILAAFFGMATKYSEGLLAVKYRTVDEDGHALGGPFYYIERGMGKKWKWLAKIFAFFGMCVGLFGIGTFTQVNGIASAVKDFFDPNSLHTVTIPGIGEYSWAVIVASLVLAICVALVIIGGIQRIAEVSQIIVPFMAIVYVAICLLLLVCNFTKIPEAVVIIVKSAFAPQSIAGGIAGSMIIAMQKGIARGIFSNEAGLGSAPIAAAAAKTKEPVETGSGNDDRYVYRYDHHLYDDRSFHRSDRSVAGRRSRRCSGYHLRVPERSSDSGAGGFLHSDGLSGILRLYDDSRMGLLRRTLPRIFLQRKQEERYGLPLDLYRADLSDLT